MFRDKAIRLVVNQPCRILNEIKAFDVDGNVIEYNENDVLEKIAELQAEYDAKQYQRDRKYPDLGEQFDLLFKDINEGTLDKTGGFYTAIKAVKDAHPKPSE
jgi:hypothetical protein